MSRFTVINEMSNGVTGTFVLHDLLSISTMSGSINITVVPQPASSSRAPAELVLNTASGSIKVTMAPFLHDPSIVIPERIFNSTLKSMSGSITAALVHNSETTLSTMSGNIAASVYPLRRPSSMSHVDVRCMSGSTSLILHPYLDNPRASLRTLTTDFRGSSGGLHVRLPSTWEGAVMSHLNSGRVRHEWEGLRVLKDGPRFAATKGNGLGQLNIWASSMDVELVGERMPVSPREVEVHEVKRVPGSLRAVEVHEEGAGTSGSPREIEVLGRESVPVLPSEVEVKEQGERVPVTPGMPELPREVEVQEEGERIPDLPNTDEAQESGELTPDSPKEEEWQGREEDDEDWTIVGDEDRAQEFPRRPMPTGEALRTRDG
ncbi:MAG: hypothetical protein ASARMPREDX12_005361 [Alectoria sarmentosa]|nr:MAG: hypothetical protein ASARMPREDX12_005361 [Alectoria sarmentosa]